MISAVSRFYQVTHLGFTMTLKIMTGSRVEYQGAQLLQGVGHKITAGKIVRVDTQEIDTKIPLVFHQNSFSFPGVSAKLLFLR
jgi:hypothetical protein